MVRSLQSGYTLIELLVVIAILGLIAVLAVPGTTRVVDGLLLTSDVRAVGSELRRLKQAARDQNSPLGISIAAGAVSESDGTVFALPHGSRIGLDRGAIWFFADGTSTGGVATISREGGTATITIGWLTGDIAFGSNHA